MYGVQQGLNLQSCEYRWSSHTKFPAAVTEDFSQTQICTHPKYLTIGQF